MSSEAEVKAEPTGGKWKYDVERIAVLEARDDGKYERIIADLGGWIDATIPDEETHANGILMAASKDLLEACEETYAALTQLHCYQPTILNRPIDNLKAAIAKATKGVSP